VVLLQLKYFRMQAMSI